MTTEHRALVHACKRIAKIAWDAQNERLSPQENEELDNIIYVAMELAGADDMTVGQFTQDTVT